MIVNAKRKIESTTNNRSSRVAVCFFINWCRQQHFCLPQTSISWRLYRQKWRRCKWSVLLVNFSLRIASPLAILDDLLDTDWFGHDSFWSLSLCSVLVGKRETDRHKKEKFYGQSCLYQGLQASLTKIILYSPILTSDCVNYALKTSILWSFWEKNYLALYISSKNLK